MVWTSANGPKCLVSPADRGEFMKPTMTPAQAPLESFCSACGGKDPACHICGTPAQDATALADKFAHGDVNAVQFNLGPDRNFEARFWPTIGGARVRNADTPDDGYATHAEALVAGAQYRNDCRATLRAMSQTPDAIRNWTEDASHENGNYECRCVECGQMFIGHKRRVLCKACSGLLTPSASAGPQAEAWCDIATAPKEKWIIGYTSWGQHVGKFHEWVGPCEWITDHFEFANTDFDAFPLPTHWQPWPAPKSEAPHPQPQQAETCRIIPGYRLCRDSCAKIGKCLQVPNAQQADGRGAAGKSVLVDQLAVKHLRTWGADLKHAVMLTAFANELLRTVPSAVEALAADFENSAHHVWDNQEVADRLRALQQSPATDNAPAVGAHDRGTPCL